MTTDFALLLAIGAGVAAILYGILSIRWIIAQPPATPACRKSPRPSRRAPRPT